MSDFRARAEFVLAGLLAAALAAAAQQSSMIAPVLRKPPLGLDLYMPTPDNNPLTAEKVALGRRLFFNPELSCNRSLACASCHDPRRGFTDGRRTSVGVFGRKGKRNVPTLINRGYGTAFFWDGRASTLEEQVVRPIQDPNEMDMPLDELVLRLKHHRSYLALFNAAFGRPPNPEDLARAMASYVRTILSGNSRLDRYLDGQQGALPELARQGLRIFRGKRKLHRLPHRAKLHRRAVP